MEPFTENAPEIIYLILDSMDDKTLFNFSKSNKYSRILCSDRLITNRIQNYKRLLNYKLDLDPDIIRYSVSEILHYPYILYTIDTHEIKAFEICNDDFYILTVIEHEVPGYREDGTVKQYVEFFENQFDIDDVFRFGYQCFPKTKFELDFRSLYNIYLDIGCDFETAKDKIINYINKYYAEVNKPPTQANFKIFKVYDNIDTHLIFKTNAFLLNLTNNEIGYMEQNDIDVEFWESDYYYEILDEIDEYYILLLDYFSKL